jgi:hypothetical protein
MDNVPGAGLLFFWDADRHHQDQGANDPHS